MHGLAAALSAERHRGDAYLLYGPVGAGKSTFSRAFIRAAAEDPELTVPSPTYLLQLVYEEAEGPPIHHYDLYRLSDASDLQRLSLQQAFSGAVALIEWPERLSSHGQLPRSCLEVHIEPLDMIAQRHVQQRLDDRVGTGSSGAAAATLGTSSSAAPGAAAGGGSETEPATSSSVAAQVAGGFASAAAARAAGSTGVGQEDTEGEDEGEYADRRWRHIRLVPIGSHWQGRLHGALQRLHASGATGVAVLDP